eukprot:TRINITY_DN19528_c0_g1_i1.p1 TRINITY_DN19528_c0_g1~~TRINITY_DN19528_c0_g1_i1.p1  ORF type:complete len:1010 (-),score=175.94 TRINITY_DN19528_c0_g1_i1:222-3230(-)
MDDESNNVPSPSRKWSYIVTLPRDSQSGIALCSCFSWLAGKLVSRERVDERESFEQTVAFLRSVPLFKKQLPSSQLPKLATDLKRKVWKPGAQLVKQGETGRAFFLIQAGEASLLVADSSGKNHVRATLYPGDYFGGHTLVSERPNVGSVVANGPEELVTLSMSTAVFESSGLKAQLTFPKRPALYFDRASAMGGLPGSGSDLVSMDAKAPSEEAFLLEALRKNVNLRSLSDVRNEVLRGIACGAVCMSVPQGNVVLQSGKLAQDFFIIKSGKIHAVADCDSWSGPKSAEAAVAQLTMTERLKRKQAFLTQMCRSKPRRRTVTTHFDATPKAELRVCPQANPKASGLPHAATDDSIDEMLGPRVRRSQSEFGSDDSPTGTSICQFQVGDKVAWISLDQHPCAKSQVGTVTQLLVDESGQALVKVGWEKGSGDTRSGRVPDQTVAPHLLRHAQQQLLAELVPGDSFGELSLIYNTLPEATFSAVEASVVYKISRKHFKAHFNRRGHRFKEYVALLDEVRALEPLLQAERWELACNAVGLFSFKPGERVLTQGVPRKARLWYVLFAGSCVLTSEQPAPDGRPALRTLAELQRAGHFGERSLLRGGEGCVPEVTCEAGPQGMTCLTFEGEGIRIMLEGLFRDGAFGVGAEALLPGLDNHAEDYHRAKGVRRRTGTGSRDSEVKMSSLRKLCLLGSGGFANVFLVEDASTNKRYALKQLSKGHVEKQQAVMQVCWERDLLMMVDSPFACLLHRTFKDAESIYLLLEAVLGGSLYDIMCESSEVLTDDQPRGSGAAFYVACVIAGVEHLHDRHIVFRDLKPENVLVDERGYAKLCDMGFARFVLSKTNTLAGTPEYMAPEVIDFPHAHGMDCDWWSLGVLTFELIMGQPPFEDEGISDVYAKLLAIRRSQERELRYSFGCPALVRDFIGKLLRKLPHRLGVEGGAEQLRAHNWFKLLPFDFQALRAQTLPAPTMRPFQGASAFSGACCLDESLAVPMVGSCNWDADW